MDIHATDLPVVALIQAFASDIWGLLVEMGKLARYSHRDTRHGLVRGLVREVGSTGISIKLLTQPFN
jgi:hypothetical protein